MKTYSIFFTGEPQKETTIEQLKINLATLFKTKPEKIEKMFIGKPVCVKKLLTLEQVKKYRQAMIKAGAKVVIRETIEKSANENSTKKIIDSPIKDHSSTNISSGLAGLINYNQSSSVEEASVPEKSSDTSVEPNKSEEGALTMGATNSGSLEEFAIIVDDYTLPDLTHYSIIEGSLEEFSEPLEDYEIPNLDEYSISDANQGSLEEFSEKVIPVEIEDTSYMDITDLNDRPLSDQAAITKDVVLPDISNLELSQPIEGK